MKFLIDNALSPLIAESLRKAGFEAVHVCDIGMQASPDSSIFRFAFDNAYIIVSADTDFGTLLALQQYSKPSVILFRSSDKHPQAQASLIISHIPGIKDALESGSVIVFEDNRIRIRTLPIN